MLKSKQVLAAWCAALTAGLAQGTPALPAAGVQASVAAKVLNEVIDSSSIPFPHNIAKYCSSEHADSVSLVGWVAASSATAATSGTDRLLQSSRAFGLVESMAAAAEADEDVEPAAWSAHPQASAGNARLI